MAVDSSSRLHVPRIETQHGKLANHTVSIMVNTPVHSYSLKLFNPCRAASTFQGSLAMLVEFNFTFDLLAGGSRL